MKKGYLVLENGMAFPGERFGADAPALGELVFTTGVVGYIETLTDPSYAGQIIMQTFPLIGNYGIIEDDFEGISAARGYVVHEYCAHPSNFRAQYPLDDFLKARGIPGLMGVDTRGVTRAIRDMGVMNAAIVDEIPVDLSFIKNFRIQNAVASVSAHERAIYPATADKKYTVALIDYGAKRNIERELTRRGCEVVLLPYDVTAVEIKSLAPDGIMLSNGPGDPAENTGCIAELRKMVGIAPIFGICLGHQLLALALGAKTEKLKFGHRGANQPVKDMQTGRLYVTSQNHGYAVSSESLAGVGEVRFINVNDKTCEGADYPDINSFTVQFHPEACAGPEDTDALFDRFIRSMGDR